MILNINEKERGILVKALSVLADEYRTLSEALVSTSLRRGLRKHKKGRL